IQCLLLRRHWRNSVLLRDEQEWQYWIVTSVPIAVSHPDESRLRCLFLLRSLTCRYGTSGSGEYCSGSRLAGIPGNAGAGIHVEIDRSLARCNSCRIVSVVHFWTEPTLQLLG